MAVAFPPTTLTSAPGVRVLVTNQATGQSAFLYTDPSGDGEVAGTAYVTDNTGTFSPAANPVYADPGTYTISYTDVNGVARTTNVTVTGAARPSPQAPGMPIEATGAAVTTAQAAGGAAALPATPKGYLPATVTIAGVATPVVLPFY